MVSSLRPLGRFAPLLIGVLGLVACRPGPPTVTALADAYIARSFETFPTRATAAGWYAEDARLEDLSPARLAAWLAFQEEAAVALRAALARPDLGRDDRLDATLLLRQVEAERHEIAVLRRPDRDPLWWTGTLANATVFLLVREDRPLAERRAAALARVEQLPRLAAQARAALAGTPASEIAPEPAAYAARQTRAAADYYRGSFDAAGATAAAALDELAGFLEDLAARATGDPRLGPSAYAERFRWVTGVEQPLDEILREAEAALVAKRAEAAGFGRSVWARLLPGEPPPTDDVTLLRRLFAELGEHRADSVEEFVADYRELLAQAEAFVRDRKLLTLPTPLSIVVDRSPAFFAGQSVGGVYPAGPFAPEAATLFYLPTPPDDAPAAARAAFFRDFNHAFNVMITPHEIFPGHAVQLAWAARHPRKVRALYADGVYVEGWGTFCERLLLDLGWGDERARVAHLKKQLENIARTIVDLRVHTQGMARHEVLRLAREEAFQDEQFAANLWARTITTAPQLTFYWLGYREVQGLYDDVRARQGAAFDLRTFLDALMAEGPVPVAAYRERLLGAGT